MVKVPSEVELPVVRVSPLILQSGRMHRVRPSHYANAVVGLQHLRSSSQKRSQQSLDSYFLAPCGARDHFVML